MNLWYKIICETLVTLRGGDRRGLNDTYICRRRSFESLRNIMKGMDEKDLEVDTSSHQSHHSKRLSK